MRPDPKQRGGCGRFNLREPLEVEPAIELMGINALAEQVLRISMS